MTLRDLARAPAVLGLALLGLSTSSGCARDQTTAPGVRALSGHVVLKGYLVDTTGGFAGTRVVGDADNVRVELVLGTKVVASTVTAGGVYRFSGLSMSTYVVRAHVGGTIRVETNPLTIARSEVAVLDTIHLASKGDLLPIPNPSSDTMRVYFDLTDPVRLTMQILSAAGDTVRTLLDNEGRPPGLNIVEWDGRDRIGNPSFAPFYWITLESGTDLRCALLFRTRFPIPAHAPERTTALRGVRVRDESGGLYFRRTTHPEHPPPF